MKNHDFQGGKMVAVRHFLKISNELYIFDGGDMMKIRTIFYGGDVDEMIDFENVKSLDL